MNSEFKTSPEKPFDAKLIKYPCILKSTVVKNLFVYFTEYGKGLILSTPCNDTGNFNSDWDMRKWKPVTTPITIIPPNVNIATETETYPCLMRTKPSSVANDVHDMIILFTSKNEGTFIKNFTSPNRFVGDFAPNFVSEHFERLPNNQEIILSN